VEPGKETISAMEKLSKALVDIFDGIAKTFGKKNRMHYALKTGIYAILINKK
jgi:hypothetical protein